MVVWVCVVCRVVSCVGVSVLGLVCERMMSC